MGRVGRYKKVKACDPFAKQRPGKKPRREFDLPPDEDQTGPLKTGKALRRQERRWAREAMGDFGDDALGEGALADVSSAPPPPRVAIDPRRANESQKAFERRLKDDSAKLLKAQADRHSSTKAKKRAYLKDKKAARKGGARDAGAAAERGAPPPPAFGDRADAPPDLSADFTAKLEGRAQKRQRDGRGDGPSKRALKAVRDAFAADRSGLESWER